METLNMQEAQAHLTTLVEKAAAGESFVIASGGKLMVKVVAMEEEPTATGSRGLGALKGRFLIPDDIKTPFKDEIEEMFYGKP